MSPTHQLLGPIAHLAHSYAQHLAPRARGWLMDRSRLAQSVPSQAWWWWYRYSCCELCPARSCVLDQSVLKVLNSVSSVGIRRASNSKWLKASECVPWTMTMVKASADLRSTTATTKMASQTCSMEWRRLVCVARCSEQSAFKLVSIDRLIHSKIAPNRDKRYYTKAFIVQINVSKKIIAFDSFAKTCFSANTLKPKID